MADNGGSLRAADRSFGFGFHDDEDDDDGDDGNDNAVELRDSILAVTMSSRQTAGVALYSFSSNTIFTGQLLASAATLSEWLEAIIQAAPPRRVITNTATANDLGLISFLTGDGEAEHDVTSAMNWDFTTAKLRVVEHLFVRDLMDSSASSSGVDGKHGGGGGGGGARGGGRDSAFEGDDDDYDDDQHYGGCGSSSSSSSSSSNSATSPNNNVSYDNSQLLASELPFSERARLSALGGLVGWLSKHEFNWDKSGHVHVRSLAPIETLVRGRCVIDALSLRALSIFVEEFHPSQVKGRGRSKEGFSLFGIFDRTASRGGRRCLKEWFRSPLSSLEGIRFRQNGVELFSAPEVREIEADIHKGLRKMHDLPAILLRVKKVQATYRDWVKVSETCEALWSVIDLLRVLGPRVGDACKRWIADKLDRCDLQVLKTCYQVVSESIDVELSKSTKQTCIREGFSDELDALRAQCAFGGWRRMSRWLLGASHSVLFLCL